MERELLLLGLLRRGDAHGYGLNEFIEQHLTLYADLKKPTAYFLLDKMAREGLVERHAAQVGNRPPRRVYRLTERGVARFLELLRECLSSYTPTRYVADVGLAFADMLPRAETVALLRQQRAGLAQQRAYVEEAAQHGGGALDWVVEHHRRVLQTELQWLDDVIASFETPDDN